MARTRKLANGSSAPPAVYTTADDALILEKLGEKKAAGLMSDNGFKKATWEDVAVALVEIQTSGGTKTVASIKARYQRLKKLFGIVKEIREKSGWSWSEAHGAEGVPEDAWKAFVARRPDARAFRTQGFALYDEFVDLLDDSVADGRDVDRPTRKRARDDSEDEDDGEDEGDASEEEKDSEPSSSQSRTIPPVTKRTPAASTPRPAKIAKLTPSQQAVTKMSDSIHDLATALATRAAPPAAGSVPDPALLSTPHRRIRAIKIFQSEEGLTSATRSSVLQMFNRDISVADTYTAIEPQDFDLRRAWLRAMLSQQFPGEVFTDLDDDEW